MSVSVSLDFPESGSPATVDMSGLLVLRCISILHFSIEYTGATTNSSLSRLDGFNFYDRTIFYDPSGIIDFSSEQEGTDNDNLAYYELLRGVLGNRNRMRASGRMQDA